MLLLGLAGGLHLLGPAAAPTPLSGFGPAAAGLRPDGGRLDPARVQQVAVKTHGKRVELRRAGENGGWRVVSRDGYPADDAAVDKLVRELTGARVVMEATEPPSRLAAYGLRPTDEAGSRAARVTLRDADGNRLLVVRFGFVVDLPSAGDGKETMAAFPAQDRVVVLEGALASDIAERKWLAEVDLPIQGEAVREIHVKPPEQSAYRFVRDEKGGWYHVLPDGERSAVLKPKLLRAIIGDLEDFSFLDVRAHGERSRPQATPLREVRVGLADSVTLTFHLYKDEEGTWLNLAAATAECGQDCQAADRARRIGERFSDWSYRLPVSGAAMFDVSPAEIVE